MPIWMECIVKEVDYVVLHGTIQVDEKVSTSDQVYAQKWRIAEQVVRGEDDEISNFLTDTVSAIFFGEEPLETVGGHVDLNIAGKNSFARRIQRSLMKVGCEDLYLR